MRTPQLTTLGLLLILAAPAAWLYWVLAFMSYEDSFSSADSTRFGTLEDMGILWFVGWLPALLFVLGASLLGFALASHVRSRDAAGPR